VLPLIILSLVGITPAAFVFDSDPAQEEDPGLTQDDDTVTASEGDDILEDEDFDGFDLVSGDSSVILNLLAGDDVFDQADLVGDYSTVNGGDGDDSLTAGGGSAGDWEGTLNGDDGNDTLSGNAGAQLFGGAGDDVLSYDMTPGGPDLNLGAVDGGEGDDHIHVQDIWGDEYFAEGPNTIVTGGEGADIITLEVIDGVDDPATSLSVGPEGEDTSLITIQDFEPGVDSLTIDITSFAENGNLDFTATELTEQGEGLYQLSLSFLADGATNPFTANLNIQSQAPLTLDDVELIADDEAFSTISGDTVTGSAGDDIITDGLIGDSSFIDSGAGNDEILIGVLEDELSVTIEGGDGNDTLTGIDLLNSDLSGGAGDDVINLEQKSFAFNGGPVILDGGEGNDTLNLALGTPLMETSGASNYSEPVEASGGDGADMFHITLDATPLASSTSVTGTLDPFTGTEPILAISDFDPNEDALLLDLTNSPGLTDVQSVETRLGSSGETELIVNFLNEAGDPSDAVINLGQQPAGFDLANASVTVLLPMA